MSLFNSNKLTAEQRLSKAVNDIMQRETYIPLQGVMMIGERRVKDDAPTAYTNGRDEFYGRGFIDTVLTKDAWLRFVVLHEVRGHKLLRHLDIYRHIFEVDADCTNRACDYYINQLIIDENPDGWAAMPMRDGKPLGLLDERFRGMSVMEIFKILRQEKEENDGSGQGDGECLDEHGWDDANSMSEAEKQQLEQEIDTAIREGQIQASKLGASNTMRDIAELLETQVDWREVLREFIKSTCSGKDYSTYTRPNRRYMGTGVYMPSGVSEQVNDIVFAVDMSGSIGAREQASFMTELVEVCKVVKPNKVHIMYWDTEVARHEVYLQHEIDDLLKSTKPTGGGGTMVECVPEYMKANNIKAECAIVLTDGYLGGSWGQWSVPVLWCVLNNKRAVPSSGKAVHIKSEDM